MSDITRSEAIKTLKEHLSHWERLLQEHICFEQEGIDTISALKLAIASLETDEAYQLEYEKPEICEDAVSRKEVLNLIVRSLGKSNTYIHTEVLKMPSVLPKSKTATENCIDCVYDEIETEEGTHCKKCLAGDNSQYKYVFDFVRENLKADKPSGKWITTKQLEDMYKKFERKLWNEREDVRGDDMVEIGFAEQFLQDGLMELGCWDSQVD